MKFKGLHLMTRIVFLTIFILCVGLIGCTTVNYETATPTNTSDSFASSDKYSTNTMTPTASPIPTLLLVEPTIPTSTKKSNTATPLPIKETPTLTPHPSPTPVTPVVEKYGQLYVHDYLTDSIIEIDVTNKTQTTLLSKNVAWERWDVIFATAKPFVAYWFQNDKSVEFWISSLNSWAPEQLLDFDSFNYDSIKLEWIANDAYLLIQLGYEDSLGIFYLAESYLLNVQNLQFEHMTGWVGDCSILAYSPRTQNIATWCPTIKDFIKSSPYIVIESDGEVWNSPEAPEIILTETTSIWDAWAWSSDNKSVAFGYYENTEQGLYIINVENISPTPIVQNRALYPDRLRWSPNNQYISFSGALSSAELCSNRNACMLIVDVFSQEIIWESNHVNVRVLAWSPNSKLVAIDNNVNLDVIDIGTNKTIIKISNIQPVDMIWVLNE